MPGDPREPFHMGDGSATVLLVGQLCEISRLSEVMLFAPGDLNRALGDIPRLIHVFSWHMPVTSATYYLGHFFSRKWLSLFINRAYWDFWFQPFRLKLLPINSLKKGVWISQVCGLNILCLSWIGGEKTNIICSKTNKSCLQVQHIHYPTSD